MAARTWAIIGLLAAMPTFGSAEPPTAVQTAEACLRANAVEIARQDRSLESAAGFLVNYVCAVEVEAATRWLRNSDLVATLTHGAPDAAGKLRIDPVSGRLLVPPEPGKSPTDGLGALNLLQSAFPPSVAPSLKADAARLILEARFKERARR